MKKIALNNTKELLIQMMWELVGSAFIAKDNHHNNKYGRKEQHDEDCLCK